MTWYLKVLRNYAVFSGRARRKEYWYFVLFNSIIILFLGFIDQKMVTTPSPSAGMGLFGGVYTLFVVIPAIAVTIRRLHDTDRSGWWFLVFFVPIVGPILLLFFTLQDSKDGSNRYGENPKGIVF